MNSKLSLLFLISFFMLFSNAYSQVQTPPSFRDSSGNQVVFPDFQKAEYKITYDVQQKAAFVESTIQLQSFEAGHIAFDIIPTPLEIFLDQMPVQASLIATPNYETSLKILSVKTEAGTHILKIKSKINLVVWDQATVSSAFFMSDLTDRSFLEKYIPAGFEWDPYEMIFDVEVTNTKVEHIPFANGVVKNLGFNHWSIQFPNYFSTSSVYFHVTVASKYRQLHFDYKSVDGRSVPGMVYGFDVTQADVDRIKNTVQGLESDLGPWPHPKILVYFGEPGVGLGGMEYCGATVTERYALVHELAHSYFARGVMPVNGNAGWLDEAVVTWYTDTPSTVRSSDHYRRSNLANFGTYNRETSSASYGDGGLFIAYLNYNFLQQNKNFTSFLKDFFSANVFRRITTDDFQNSVQLSLGKSLQKEFRSAIYNDGVRVSRPERSQTPHPIHKVLTDEQLRQLM